MVPAISSAENISSTGALPTKKNLTSFFCGIISSLWNFLKRAYEKITSFFFEESHHERMIRLQKEIDALEEKVDEKRLALDQLLSEREETLQNQSYLHQENSALSTQRDKEVRARQALEKTILQLKRQIKKPSSLKPSEPLPLPSFIPQEWGPLLKTFRKQKAIYHQMLRATQKTLPTDIGLEALLNLSKQEVSLAEVLSSFYGIRV